MDCFFAITAPSPLIFLSSLSNIDEVALVTNLGQTSLVLARNSPVWTVLYPSTYC